MTAHLETIPHRIEILDGIKVAYAAYCEAALKYHGEFARTK